MEAYWKILRVDEYIDPLPDKDGKYSWKYDRDIIKAGKMDVKVGDDVRTTVQNYTGFESYGEWEVRADNKNVFYISGDSVNAEHCWEWLELECGFISQKEIADSSDDNDGCVIDNDDEHDHMKMAEILFDRLEACNPYELAHDLMNAGSIVNVALKSIQLDISNEKEINYAKTELLVALAKVQLKVNDMVLMIEDE